MTISNAFHKNCFRPALCSKGFKSGKGQTWYYLNATENVNYWNTKEMYQEWNAEYITKENLQTFIKWITNVIESEEI